MKKFECRCNDNFSHVNNGNGNLLVNLEKNKLYICEYLHSLDPGFKSFKIRVYDGIRFIWFEDENIFSKYFDHTQYLRKKKLEKLNLAINAKKTKI